MAARRDDDGPGEVRKKRVLRLRDAPPKDADYVFNDTQRMMKALSDAGFVATYRAVKTAWEQHSADYCATWLQLPGPGADGDRLIVDLLLEGEGEDGVSKGDDVVSLNGRANGPFLVDANSGEKVVRKSSRLVGDK